MKIYIQITLALFMIVIIFLECMQMMLERKINKDHNVYTRQSLIDKHEKLSQKYALASELKFVVKGLPSYNPIEKKIVVPDAKLFSKIQFFYLFT